MARRFYTLDVFTNQPMHGNPLAVILDSQGLDSTKMQSIAREFNLSETVFICSPSNPINTAKIRIFTPTKELPFAGHPTIGTAILLATLDAPDLICGKGGVTIALEQKISVIHVNVTKHEALGYRAVFEIPLLSQRTETEFDTQPIATALGLETDQIGFKSHTPSKWSAGVPFIMVPIKNLAAIQFIKITDSSAWSKAFGATPVFTYTDETCDPANHVHARMFSPAMGMVEDPATGSAAAAFSGVAVAFEQPANGSHQLVIEQGYEMGRPSQIAVDIDVFNGAATHVRIGGSAVIISEGKLYL